MKKLGVTEKNFKYCVIKLTLSKAIEKKVLIRVGYGTKKFVLPDCEDEKASQTGTHAENSEAQLSNSLLQPGLQLQVY